MIEIEGAAICRLLLCPTAIRAFQAKRVQNGERGAIAAMMQHLCAALHTTARWDEHEGHLEIRMTR